MFEMENLIVGERILGEVDPRTLTREEFEASPDLLFHGSSGPFNFSRAFDYRCMDYLTVDEASSVTLGFGFYATDRENAADYSEIRVLYSLRERRPLVTTILPYRARCLDLRLKTDLLQNAPLPKDFINSWMAFYRASIENMDRYKGVESFMEDNLLRMDEYYLECLEDMREEEATVLKKLLYAHHFPGPMWMYTFHDFMIDLGFDGLIVNGGSEKVPGKRLPEYVFYNLDKIGTYETWNL